MQGGLLNSNPLDEATTDFSGLAASAVWRFRREQLRRHGLWRRRPFQHRLPRKLQHRFWECASRAAVRPAGPKDRQDNFTPFTDADEPLLLSARPNCR